MIRFLWLSLYFSIASYASGQNFPLTKSRQSDMQDTLTGYTLDTVQITSHPLINYNYSRYVFIVRKVYPLADTAVKLLHLVEDTTADMRNRQAKDYKKSLEKALRESFEDKLKNLTRSEGEVMIALIERNTGRSMYDILGEVKSNGTAFWWQGLGKLYGYDLKSSYDPDANPTLEMIIADYEAEHGK